MGVKVWIGFDPQYGRYYVLDFPSRLAVGPIEISNELYERFMENERETQVLQGIMSNLEYEWTYPEEDERDCD